MRREHGASVCWLPPQKTKGVYRSSSITWDSSRWRLFLVRRRRRFLPFKLGHELPIILAAVPDTFSFPQNPQRHAIVRLPQHLLEGGEISILPEQSQTSIGSIENMVRITSHQRSRTSRHSG